MSEVQPPLFTDMTALAGLKRDAAAGGVDNLREVARQFEALFTHMLMKNMRAASLSDGLLDNQQSKFYRDMFDQQLSTELSDRGGLGIADLLVRQLGGTAAPAPTDQPLRMPVRPLPPTAPTPAAEAQESVSAASATQTAGDGESGGPLEFVRKLLPHARRAGQMLGIAPQLLLAQAALESGWGSRPIRAPDGSDSHNLFGIKADARWQGSRAVVDTLEYTDGVAQREKAAFRAYGSLADSFDDYAGLLTKSTRYREALNTGDDAAAFAGALQKGGYATDPSYASKILRIATGRTLRGALDALGALKNP